MPDGFHALVRRRRDGALVFDLDLVHAGVVAEALEQTRAVLDGSGPAATTVTAGRADGDDRAGRTGPDAPGQAAEPDEFDAIVANLSDVGAASAGREDDPGREDPVVRRLLPDAFLDDAEGSEEFRRLSGDTVRGHKVGAIDSVLADLATLQAQDGGVAVPPERAGAWLTALNDARLALGTLLAVGEDDDLDAELDDYEQQVQEQVSGGTDEAGEQELLAGERALRAYRIAVYDFLSALLEMVVRALDR